MGLIDSFRNFLAPQRSIVWPGPMTGVDNLWPYNSFDGHQYALALNETMRSDREEIAGGFIGYANGAYKANSVVFALMATRQMLFSEARFQYQRMRKGRPGELWGDASLDILEHPWPNATTGDLLSRTINDNDLAGNFYATRRRNRIVRMRPDWVSLIIGSDNPDLDVEAGDLDAELVGLIYYPGGRYSGRTPVPLLREQFAHVALHPDPLASYMGMSWLTPVIREIMGDQAATTHKLKFFENGATPNMIVKRSDSLSKESFAEWVALMRSQHEGLAHAYKTFWLTAGADATVVGKDLQQLDFKVVQGAGESRLAAAARIHPAIVGLSEGLQGASLNAGNFGAARRLVADGFLRPAWRNFAGSMETLVPPPSGSRLWYDEYGIAFLREDRKDAADIQFVKSQTSRQYIDAGFLPDSVVAAVDAEDPKLLKHSGLFSVQLQKPGAGQPAPPALPTGGAP
jgi:hypothetical protein